MNYGLPDVAFFFFPLLLFPHSLFSTGSSFPSVDSDQLFHINDKLAEYKNILIVVLLINFLIEKEINPWVSSAYFSSFVSRIASVIMIFN